MLKAHDLIWKRTRKSPKSLDREVLKPFEMDSNKNGKAGTGYIGVWLVLLIANDESLILLDLTHV